MKARIIPIGNSQGIRIPKAIIEQCGFDRSVHMEVIDGSLILTPTKKVREGWEKSFREMAANGDDKLLINDAISAVEQDSKIVKKDLTELKEVVNQIKLLLGWLKWIGGASIAIALSLVANFVYSLIT